MTDRATGLVLRTRRLTETSLIVHWLTPGSGRLGTVAKGALRPGSPFRGRLDLFFEADFSFARSRRSDLHTLREVILRETHPELRQDLGRLRQAAYGAELIEQTTETDTPLPAIYELAREFLKAVALSPPKPRTVFAFELKLLTELGLQPDWETSRLTPGAKRLTRAFAESDWFAVARLNPSAAQSTEVRLFLHEFLGFHLGKIPKGRNAALS